MPGPAGSRERLWDARIARARGLAADYPAAASLLTFYAALAGYQRALAPLTQDAVVALVPAFLSWLAREPTAPAGLTDAAITLGGIDRVEWQRLVGSCLSAAGPPPPAPDVPSSDTVIFVVEAMLQPLAALTAGACPSCAGLPVLGVFREEGHGAQRSLVCPLCLAERTFLRVVCPACGEQAFESLPVYTADQFGHVRIDACDACRRYLKTIDLTKDGLAVPIVDDLASVTMDLWAREQGYARLRPNLLRT
jgi:FdhE protein